MGILNDNKIDGVELEKEIYLESLNLQNRNIKIFNEDILKFDVNNTKYDLFILNDPLKKMENLHELIIKIKKLYNQGYFIFINLNQEKIKCISENLNMIDSFIISKNKNILFCSIE